VVLILGEWCHLEFPQFQGRQIDTSGSLLSTSPAR
jgi:hypothetical protein